MRERILRVGLETIAIVAVATELLSAAHMVARPAVAALSAALVAFWVWRLRSLPRPRFAWDLVTTIYGGGAVLIWLVSGVVALVSPPNTSDAMAYHMPRVVYWMQQQSVEFFATPYLNQIMLQPLHEYLILWLEVLTGGDRLANAVAWMATAGGILGVSLIARQLGAGVRGQALTALLAATLPNGILQASGVKNEALLAFLLVMLVYYALQRENALAGLACALACLTKATAFVFSAPILLLLAPRAVPQAVVLVLVLNGPFFWRNYDLSGSPLGFDSAHADGRYRWKNEGSLTGALLSNLLRHASEQVGARPAAWNEAVYGAVVSVHRMAGLDENAAGTTWPETKYEAPRATSHETDANNRWHLALLVGAAAYWLWRREGIPLRLLVALLLGVLGFCLYLKWQPHMLRMWLPHYLIGMGVAGVALGRLPAAAQVALVLFLLDGTRLPLLKNWVRPLRGAETIFNQSREDLYFSDLRPWNVKPQYDEVLRELSSGACRSIGMDINYFQMEYPVQAILLKKYPDMRFVHVNVNNPSRKYESRTKDVRPCRIVCLACDRWLAQP